MAGSTWERLTECDQCPHPIAEHVLWEPDEICEGWMHCTADGCTQCWHQWPALGREPQP